MGSGDTSDAKPLYSPILARAVARTPANGRPGMAGIDWQQGTNCSVSTFAEEYNTIPKTPELPSYAFHFNNGVRLWALVLYCMVRHLQ
jgi:hypothetical protein